MNLYRIYPTNKDDLWPKGWVQCYDRIVWAKDALHAEKLARLYDNDPVEGWKKIPLTVTQIDLTDEKEFIISSSYRGYD